MISVRAAISGAIHEVDPTQGVSNVGLVEQDIDKALARPPLIQALSAWLMESPPRPLLKLTF